jgi:hypothetical protein
MKSSLPDRPTFRSQFLGALLAVLSLAVARLPSSAAVPDSLAGKVYRTTSFFSTRVTHEATVVFRANGRFVYVMDGNGSSLNTTYPRTIFLNAPKADGTYVYRRTSTDTAEVELSHDDGLKTILSLQIPTDTDGRPGNSTDFLTEEASLQSAPASNISMRGTVAPGRPLIVGFVVPGSPSPYTDFVPSPTVRQREVLIRVVGPSLAAFGVTGGWADPDFKLFKNGASFAPNEFLYSDWAATARSDPGAAFEKIFNYVGAFPLRVPSKDAVALVRLDPGNYTIIAPTTNDDPGGEALIEVYFLP